jgi:hypothetical protein
MTTTQDPSTDRARSWTVAAWLMPLSYLVWFWVMFALGYWVTDAFDAYPSTDVPLIQTGLDGVLAAIGYGLVCGLPSWIGVWLAVRARRLGAGAAAVGALALNLVMAIGWFALAFT